MGPWYYEVVSFDGDYVNLRRTDIESDELNPVALALAVERWNVCTVRNPSFANKLQTNSQYTILSSTTMIFVLSIIIYSPFLLCQSDNIRTHIQHGSHGFV